MNFSSNTVTRLQTEESSCSKESIGFLWLTERLKCCTKLPFHVSLGTNFLIQKKENQFSSSSSSEVWWLVQRIHQRKRNKWWWKIWNSRWVCTLHTRVFSITLSVCSVNIMARGNTDYLLYHPFFCRKYQWLDFSSCCNKKWLTIYKSCYVNPNSYIFDSFITYWGI